MSWLRRRSVLPWTLGRHRCVSWCLVLVALSEWSGPHSYAWAEDVQTPVAAPTVWLPEQQMTELVPITDQQFTSAPAAAPVAVPVVAPTRAPTPAPTRAPTRPPARAPTRPPTRAPTRPPTLRPTVAPTKAPTVPPTPAPTLSPSFVPSDAPSILPSKAPTGMPSSLPSTLAPTTIAPTTITPMPTSSSPPSSMPSQGPSRAPSLAPSLAPTGNPSAPPTNRPTAAPSTAPTLSLQRDTVDITMRMTSIPGRLERSSAIQWEAATAEHIRRSILAQTTDRPLMELMIRTNIESQFTQAFNAGRRVVVHMAEEGNAIGGPRFLQEVVIAPLRVSFFATVSFRSTFDNYDWASLIGDAFNSDDERSAYVARLRATGDRAFDPLGSVTLLVEGETPIEELPDQDSEDSGGNNLLIVIVACIAGGSVLLALVGLFIYRQSSSAPDIKVTPKLVEQHHSTSQSVPSQRAGYSTEINVDRQDDISTLGDPMFGMGGMHFGAGDGLQRDEQTASVGNDYDYNKEYLHSQGIALSMEESSRSRLTSTDSDRVSGNSTFSKMGKLNPTVFADDSSFEEQFVEEEEEEEEVERFTVNVPAGKLGMVIDTPEGSLPIVHAIKEWSILENTVKMGDKLIFVDDEDVTEMTAVEISKLISLRSDRPRSLVFHRVLPRSDFIDMY